MSDTEITGLGGTIAGDGQTVDVSGLAADGTLTVTGGAVACDSASNAGLVAATDGATLTFTAPSLANSGEIEANGNGTVVIDGSVAGAGMLAVGTGSVLEIGGATSDWLQFGGPSATLKLDAPASFTGIIEYPADGDTIDLVGTAVTTAAVTGQTTITWTGPAGLTSTETISILTVTETNGAILTYDLTDVPASYTITVGNDGNGGSDIVFHTTTPVPTPQSHGFQLETLPTAVFAAPETTVSLQSVLAQTFGSSLGGFADVWLTYEGAAYLAQNDYSYWTPASGSTSDWFVNGSDIGPGFSEQTRVSATNVGTAELLAGNEIGAYAYLTVPASSNGSQFVQYAVPVIDPALEGPAAEALTAPTPADIVASAEAFNAYYGNLPNDNDCANIAGDVAAAAGATLPSLSLNPSENVSEGFWRIVYQGNGPNPTADWTSLLQPGDVVRLAWRPGIDPGIGHEFTVLAVDPDGSIEVYDNTDYIDGVESIGIHTVSTFDADAIPTSVTICRLTTDGEYLIPSAYAGETLTGNVYNDEFVGMSDNVFVGGSGTDTYEPGAGTNTITGGSGMGTVVFQGDYASYTVAQNSNGGITVSNAQSNDTVSNVAYLQFADQTLIATDSNDLQLATLYQAALGRAPDAAGLEGWETIYLDNIPASAKAQGAIVALAATPAGYNGSLSIAQGFVDSPEFQAEYGALTNAQFITLMYQNVLGRAPDAAGYAGWMADMNAGMTQAMVLVGFADSPENLAHYAGQSILVA